MLNELKEIDELISTSVALISKTSNNLKFVENFEFRLSEAETIFSKEKMNFPGVYLIEIKNDNNFNTFQDWVQQFKLIWEHDDFKKEFVPNLKKKRISRHQELQEWIPIYLGKSKNVGKRVHEHLVLGLHTTTFALKLFARKAFYNNEFRISSIPIYVKNYDQIVPEVERNLRNKINPIIGKQ